MAGKAGEDVAAGFIELVSPAASDNCCCTLELENEDGTKMRIKLRGVHGNRRGRRSAVAFGG